MNRESYFAIKIGKNGVHRPYLMKRDKDFVPLLFDTIAEALKVAESTDMPSVCKVVRVFINWR